MNPFKTLEEFQDAFNKWQSQRSKEVFYRRVRGKAFRRANAYLRDKYPLEYRALLRRSISEILEEEQKKEDQQ